MAIQQNFPSTRPSLNLNFARSKTLDPRITFTRTSSATYVDENGLVKIAPANEARFDHDPVTGESLGLLIEESRVNHTINSENLSLWTATANMIPTGNAILLPNGTISTGVEYRGETTEANSKLLRPSPSGSGVTAGDTWVFSVFLRAGTEDTCFITILDRFNSGGTGRAFDMVNGVFLGTQGYSGTVTGGQTGVEKYSNGWYRAWISGIFTADEPQGHQIYLRLNANSNSIPLTTSFSAWGSQLEKGSFPTSYIPTTDSTATRTPDNVSITGSNFSSWYNPNEGTIFCSANNNPGITTSTSRIFYDFRNSASGDFIRKWIWNGNTGLLLNSIYTSDGGPIAAEFLTSLETENKKTAISYKQNDFARSYNGSVPLTDGGGNTPVGVNELQIGTDLSGYISQLIYYPSRLPNTTLQTLTK